MAVEKKKVDMLMQMLEALDEEGPVEMGGKVHNVAREREYINAAMACHEIFPVGGIEVEQPVPEKEISTIRVDYDDVLLKGKAKNKLAAIIKNADYVTFTRKGVLELHMGDIWEEPTVLPQEGMPPQNINELLGLFDGEHDRRIDGKVYHPEKAKIHEQLVAMCKEMFPPKDAQIAVELPSRKRQYVSIDVITDSTDTAGDRHDKLLKMIKMADDVAFLNYDEERFCISFVVEDIWTEE